MPVTRFRSVRAILNLLILTAVLPVAGILLQTYIEQRNHLIDDAEQEVLLITRSMSEVMAGITDSVRQTLSTLAETGAVRTADGEASSTLLATICKLNPRILNMAMTDPAGMVIAANHPHNNISLADRRHVRQALLTGRFSAGEYIVTRMGASQSTFSYAYPVTNQDGAVIGVLTAVLQIDAIEGFLDFSRLPEGSFMALTDHKGIRLLYHPARETNPVGSPIKNESWEIGRDTEQARLFRQSGSDGTKRVFAVEPLRLAAGDQPYIYAWAGIPEKSILQPLNAMLLRNVLLMLLVTGLALTLSRLIGGIAFIRPIKRLVAATEKLAGGYLKRPTGMTSWPEEFGTLARAFDTMAESLQQNHDQLQKQQHHLEAAQRIAHIGSWEWRAADDTYTWSKELYRLLGGSKPELSPSIRLDSALGQANGSLLRTAMAETLSTGVPLQLEVHHNNDDGNETWFIIRGERDVAGNIRGTVLDISSRKLEEKERETLHKQLLHAQKLESIGRLAGGVAHDFNNMLGVIIGHTELALDTVSPGDPLQENLLEIDKAAKRSSNLVRKLLAFARRQSAVPRIIDLNGAISGTLTMLQRLIGEEIRLLWQPAGDLHPVYIDPDQIDQILANVCVNAKDAITGTGTIIIETRNIDIGDTAESHGSHAKPGSYVQIAVSDTGCGMPPDILKHIFEPFFTTKELGKGTGLGMSTVFGIVSQNGGFITINSSPGAGTSMFIHLPRHQPAATETNQNEQTPGSS